MRCALCGKNLGRRTPGIQTADGIVCADCLQKAGCRSLPHPEAVDTETLRERIRQEEKLAASFTETAAVANYFSADSLHHLFRIGETVFPYEILRGFEWIEDGQVLDSDDPSKISKAVNWSPWSNCRSMILRINPQGGEAEDARIVFISSTMRRRNTLYLSAKSFAGQCVELLRGILAENGGIPGQETAEGGNKNSSTTESESAAGRSAFRSEAAETAGQAASDSVTEKTANQNTSGAAPAGSFSAANEIRKFRQLADEGIITEEEFEAKKKQLLGL